MLPSAGARNEDGQALVELALTLPILFILILGVAEFGRLAYGAIEVNNAARAGVAYGAQTLVTAIDTAGIVAAAKNDSPDIVTISVPTTTQSCTCSDGTVVSCTTAAASCLSPAHILVFLQVNTTYTMDPSFHVPGLPTTYVLKGQAIMQVAQ